MTTEKLYHCKLCARHGFLKRTAHRPPPGVSGVSCPGDFEEMTPTTCHTCHFASKHGQACPDATIIHRSPWSGCPGWTQSVALTLSQSPAVAKRSHRDRFEKDTVIVATREVQLVPVHTPKLKHGGDSEKAAELERYISEAETGLRSILKAGFFIECIAEDLPHGQLGPWVEAHCPNRKWRTVRRWEQVAGKLANELGISYSQRVEIRLYDVLAIPFDQVPDLLKPIREKIDSEIAGKSFRQLFLRFTQSEDGATPKRGRLSGHGGKAGEPTGDIAAIAEYHRQYSIRHMGKVDDELNKVGLRCLHCPDDILTAWVGTLERHAKCVNSWLNTPPGQRDPQAIAALWKTL